MSASGRAEGGDDEGGVGRGAPAPRDQGVAARGRGGRQRKVRAHAVEKTRGFFSPDRVAVAAIDRDEGGVLLVRRQCLRAFDAVRLGAPLRPQGRPEGSGPASAGVSSRDSPPRPRPRPRSRVSPHRYRYPPCSPSPWARASPLERRPSTSRQSIAVNPSPLSPRQQMTPRSGDRAPVHCREPHPSKTHPSGRLLVPAPGSTGCSSGGRSSTSPLLRRKGGEDPARTISTGKARFRALGGGGMRPPGDGPVKL